MQTFGLRLEAERFEIEGIPDAKYVVRLSSRLAKRLSDLMLHKWDLDFSQQCLDEIRSLPDSSSVIAEALWRTAIVHFYKCFGKAVRSQLSPERVFKGKDPEALRAFKFFKALRDKHVVHDENSYSQSIPGAVLNDGTKAYKVEKVVCFASRTMTLEQDTYSNLCLLVADARTWVVAEFDRHCIELTSDLERNTLEELLRLPAMQFVNALASEVDQARKSP